MSALNDYYYCLGVSAQERPETYTRRLTFTVQPENMEEEYEELPSPLPSPRFDDDAD